MVEPSTLSRRERQIMDVLYRLESASAKEVMENLSDAPSYSTVRTILQKLLEKGHVKYRESGLKYVYFPVVAPEKASRTALQNVVRTFFQGSPAMAVNSLLGMTKDELSDEELDEISKLIQQSKSERGE